MYVAIKSPRNLLQYKECRPSCCRLLVVGFYVTIQWFLLSTLNGSSTLTSVLNFQRFVQYKSGNKN